MPNCDFHPASGGAQSRPRTARPAARLWATAALAGWLASGLTGAVALVAAAAPVGAALGAQAAAPPATPSRREAAVARWTIAAPDAALAWYAVLADHALPGDGAFAFTARAAGGPAVPETRRRALAAMRGRDVLHFAPLYHPSADRAALAAALRAAARDAGPEAAHAPRAALLVGALRRAIPAADRARELGPLADALVQRRVAAVDAARLAALQRALDSLWLPALGPWLALERLDAGRLIVAPAIGAEGRLFAGTADRADNLVAVGAFADDPDAEAPLHAFAREACFPPVSRMTTADRGFRVGDAASARRASLAAVRCGAGLLDAVLPARAAAYRAFWLRRAGLAVPADDAGRRAAFDRAYPVDPTLDPGISRALLRLREVR